jgi:group II intron reverse transcriptase/maturase
VASPAEVKKVRELQRALYRAAKADPERRFHALHDKVVRSDVLERAWALVRANGGAAGIDGQTIADVERFGVSRMLDELAAELREGRWRSLPARRVFIPKPGRTGEQRPLSIPTVRDRVVQAAVKLVIEPVFEADFLSCSFGFRPKRSARDALQVLLDESWRGRRWVVETDIANCFEAIPHDRLMAAVEQRICDQKVLKLVRAMLRAGVIEHGSVGRSEAGTPQGGVISPVLCNVYLHRLDRQWRARDGVLLRYADDLLVMCSSRSQAERALKALEAIAAGLGLELKQAKTRIVHLRERGDGVDFLGFHHRIVRVRNPRYRHVTFLARWPTQAKMRQARDRIRELTDRRRLLRPVEQVVREINVFLRGFAAYFRHGNSAIKLAQINRYAAERLALFIGRRHKRGRRTGWARLIASPNRIGLIDITGTTIAPRPQVWPGKPNAAR